MEESPPQKNFLEFVRLLCDEREPLQEKHRRFFFSEPLKAEQTYQHPLVCRWLQEHYLAPALTLFLSRNGGAFPRTVAFGERLFRHKRLWDLVAEEDSPLAVTERSLEFLLWLFNELGQKAARVSSPVHTDPPEPKELGDALLFHCFLEQLQPPARQGKEGEGASRKRRWNSLEQGPFRAALVRSPLTTLLCYRELPAPPGPGRFRLFLQSPSVLFFLSPMVVRRWIEQENYVKGLAPLSLRPLVFWRRILFESFLQTLLAHELYSLLPLFLDLYRALDRHYGGIEKIAPYFSQRLAGVYPQRERDELLENLAGPLTLSRTLTGEAQNIRAMSWAEQTEEQRFFLRQVAEKFRPLESQIEEAIRAMRNEIG